MPQFEVIVHTTVKEIYVVEAETEQEAMENWWCNGELAQSEAIETDPQEAIDVTDA